MDGFFHFGTDDITLEDCERLENEAWEKVEVLEKSSGEKKTNIGCPAKETATLIKYPNNERRSSLRTREIQIVPKQQVVDKVNYFNTQCQGTEMKKLTDQLEEYRITIQELENNLSMKDGQLKLVTQSLDARRREVSENVKTIAQLRKEQAEERLERNCKLSQEVKKLKTQLSFQKHELMKLETHKIQSQRVSSSQNISYSQKVSRSVKRKAEVATSHGFDLDNSFHDSQMHGCKVPQEKVPRLEKKGKMENVCERQSNSRETKTICRTSDMTKSAETTSMTSTKPKETNHECLEPKIITLTETKGSLVKKLLLSNSCSLNDGQDFETISLLNLLKYPLKHLPEVLKDHSVDANPDQSLSQFPTWQTQAEDSDNHASDLDSGKYNLISQGLFLLLDFTNLTEKSVDTLGVIHVLFLLELYISSYIRQRANEHESKGVASNFHQKASTHRDFMTESEAQKTSFDEQEMILQTLQILKLLFYSTPGLLKFVLDRTSPALFREDDEVIVVYDSKKDKQDNENQVWEENAAGFRSLLVGNLKTLLVSGDSSSLLICHAALEVLIAMTSLSDNTQLESVFILLNSGCLVELLAKDDHCTTSTVSLVMSLLSNLIHCKQYKKLCSHTDNCILLKIQQCVCEDGENNQFLLQFFQFVMNISFSHDDSIEFLLESDCQCSFEIIRCLVLVLYDKVKYLLDLVDIEQVISDASLPIVRTGLSLLVILCTHSHYSPDHKLHVEHEFTELMYRAMSLFKNIKSYVPEHEALALQDLLEMEGVDEIEWSSEDNCRDDDVMT